MDAQQALADLTEISSHVRAAVVFDDKGKVAAAIGGNGEALARGASELLAAAEDIKTGDAPLTQLEVATGEGSVFVVRDGKTRIAATTGADPTVGLVFYDLKSALRSVKPAAKRKPAAKPPAPAKRGAREEVAGNLEVPPAEKAPVKPPAAPKKKKAAAPRKKKPDAP
jgi:predicted regulator of Ras-like GTPase activity (Roadblock/LC7/MglB family)